MIKLSVIIPVYNQEKLVVKALDSIPIRDDIEVIVCNDKSTDNSLEVIKEYKTTHPRLNMRIIENEVNIGLGATKNVLFDNARGEYINQLDSDDYLYTEEYNKVIDMLDGSDMVYVNLQKNDGDILRITPETKWNICGGPARFIRREFLGDTRCYPIRAAEDLYLNGMLLGKKPTELFTDITTYHYNFPREGSLSDMLIKGQIKIDI